MTNKATKNFEKLGQFKDGLQNPLLNIGAYTNNTFRANRYVPQFSTLKRQELEWAYQSSWICGLAVDLLAEDMTRAGIEIKCDDTTKVDEINSTLDEFCVWDRICDALKWSRLYGGAIAAILIDGDDMSKPLGEVKPGTFRGLHVFDRWQVQPSSEMNQTLGPDFGLPVSYNLLSGLNQVEIEGNKIHASRVVRLIGRKMPFFTGLAYQGWGASVLEPVYDRVQAFDLASEGAAQLVSKAYLRYYKVKGLREILTNDLTRKGFLKQMDIVKTFQGIEGMTLGDSEDEFQTFNYTFTGLPEVLLQFGQQISGGIGIPLVRLFGQSPVGLNSTGESDLRLYYDDVNRNQNTRLRSGLTKILSVVHQSLYGEKPDKDFRFTFKPLWQLTNEQKTASAQTAASAIISAMQAGAITTASAMKELKAISDTVGIFSSITDEDIAAAEEMENEMMPPEPPAPGEEMNNGENEPETIESGEGVPGANEDRPA